jgi:hypothetical protein
VDLFLLIGLLVAVGVLGLWYFGWARYNRRQGDLALRRLATACQGNARIADSYWEDSCRLHARLRFATHWIENAHVTFRLLPRPIPVQWLLCLWRKQRETVTFEANLDYAPSLHLDLFRHRWVTHHRLTKELAAKEWVISRPSPVVLTTRTHWTQELSPVVNTLMKSRGHDLLSVRFRHESPHLAATIDLDSFSDDQTAAGFVGVLRDLAAGASTHRH